MTKIIKFSVCYTIALVFDEIRIIFDPLTIAIFKLCLLPKMRLSVNLEGRYTGYKHRIFITDKKRELPCFLYLIKVPFYWLIDFVCNLKYEFLHLMLIFKSYYPLVIFLI